MTERQLQPARNNPKSFDQSATTGVHLQFNLELIAESFTNWRIKVLRVGGWQIGLSTSQARSVGLCSNQTFDRLKSRQHTITHANEFDSCWRTWKSQIDKVGGKSDVCQTKKIRAEEYETASSGPSGKAYGILWGAFWGVQRITAMIMILVMVKIMVEKWQEMTRIALEWVCWRRTKHNMWWSMTMSRMIMGQS